MRATGETPACVQREGELTPQRPMHRDGHRVCQSEAYRGVDRRAQRSEREVQHINGEQMAVTEAPIGQEDAGARQGGSKSKSGEGRGQT
jgi:hypothetical protein